jgi:phage terminase large subunit
MPDGMRQPQIAVTVPEAYEPLFWTNKPDGTPIRYKCFYGGRNAAKSWSFARALVAEAFSHKHLILCTRQFQNSIADSVYRVVENQIRDLKLAPWFEFTRQSIYCKKTGSEFIFKGLDRNINEIRSLEGVTRCWIEEANTTRLDSWLILDPTIRRDGSQIWISYNPDRNEDALHKKFVVDKPPPEAFVRKTSWRDNPWFSGTDGERLRLYMLQYDQTNYDWVWEGETRQNWEAQVFRDKVFLENFEDDLIPLKARIYYGVDFGYSSSPTCLLRCWIKPSSEGFGEDLYIDREAYSYHLELDEMAGFFDKMMPEARQWPIYADAADPQTISYLARQGFMISAAEKWPNSEEEGVRHIRGFRRVVIHETKCPNVARDFRLYSYKTDPKAVDDNGRPLVLPILLDKWDHGPDACRYALSDMIMKRGGLSVWERLVRPTR